jgi:ERCC4-related helicase
MKKIAPGSRIIVRDEEWLVKRIDRTSTGSRVLTVTGLSGLIRDHNAKFLEDLEDDLDIVDPAQTKPVLDDTPYHRGTRLHIEALLRDTAPPGKMIQLGHRAAMDVVPYQLDPAYTALQQPRQRILMADAVGLGKTIECGILLTELIERGRANRILVLAVKSMLTQFQKELWERFTIPLVRLDSAGIQSVRNRIPTNHNPFHYYDKTIVSIDTIKQDSEYRAHLENARWDVIVIDEAHNVAKRGTGAMRARVAELLADRSDSLLLLSATPHDGKRESFASIMNLLNPTAIKNPKDYGPKDIDGLIVRRFKKDVQSQVAEAFPVREVHRHTLEASPEEESAFAILVNLEFKELDAKRKGSEALFRTGLEKSLFSSPAACSSTIKERIKRLQARKEPERFKADIKNLEAFDEAIAKIGPEKFTKYQKLLSLLKGGGIDWNPQNADDRVVIFTERIPTLHFLEEHLAQDLKLNPKQIQILHGGMSDVEQQDIVEQFGSKDSTIRLLIASDVASEGINLHYQCCQMIHFDIPWALLVFQQRNGRIDRYGQTRKPQIHYLLTQSKEPKIKGDQRILELLVEKDDQVQKNIGDPSEFTGLHSVEEEEAVVTQAIEEGKTAEEFDKSYGKTPEESDDPWLADIMAGLDPDPSKTKSHEDLISAMPSLFESDYQWAKSMVEHIRGDLGQTLQVECLDEREEIHLTLPKDYLRFVKQRMPKEIVPVDTPWILSANKQTVIREIERCRGVAGEWPRVHLLWEQHPALIWLNNKIVGAYGRQEAPVVFLPGKLQSDEVIVLGTGIIPNRKGHPLIQRWVGAVFKGGSLSGELLDLDEVLEKTGLKTEKPPQTGRKFSEDELTALLPLAVEAMQKAMSEARSDFDEDTRPELERQMKRLEEFQQARMEQLEIDLGLAGVREGKQRQLEKTVSSYKQWIRDTMETEDNPALRIVAFFAG